MENIIPIRQGKEARNQERYLESLCDKREDLAISELDQAEAEFNRRQKAAKEKIS